MGLWDSIRNKLGFPAPLIVRDPAAPLSVSDAARTALLALPPSTGIHIQTIAVDAGYLVQVSEGESQGPPPDVLRDLPITLSDTDLARLSGRILDYRDRRWAVTVPLEIRARETPNPDGRLYLCDQILATGRPAFFTAGAGLPALAQRLLSINGVLSALFRDNTVTIERQPSVSWAEIDSALDIAIREHLLLCGERIDGRTATVDGLSEFEDEIRAVVAERLLPAIHRDGGDLEVVGYSNGVVKVSMVGACRTCPSSAMTLRLGVERTLKEAFPGRVERVEAI